MEDETFAVGDVVALKSGGPKMTVVVLRKDDTNLVVCQWFDVHAHPYATQDKVFHKDALMKTTTGRIFD